MQAAVSMPSAGSPHLRVLLIEASDRDALTIQRALEDASGESMRIERAASLRDATYVLARQGLDVVLIDLALRDATPAEAVRIALASAPAATILVTADARLEEEAFEAIRLGAQDYIPKAHLEGPALLRTMHYAFARRELDLARARLAAIVEASVDGIFTTTTDGIVTSWNPACADLLGYSASEALGAAVETIVPPDARGEERAHLARVMDGRESAPRDVERVRKDGRRIWVSASDSPLCDALGNVVGVATILRDITRRREADERLRASLAEKDVLLREIHHRVKNNLQTMSALLLLQSDRVADPTARTILLDSHGRVRAMAAIHQKLHESTDLSSIDFGAYFADMRGQLLSAYGATHVDIALDVRDARVPLDIAVSVGLMANEIITNAIRHGFPAGRAGTTRIAMRGRAEGGWRLEIADDGIGLPPDIDPHQATTLGLQLVSTLADQLDAVVRVVRDRGTRFEIEIPAPGVRASAAPAARASPGAAG